MLQQQVENQAKATIVDRRLVAIMQALLPAQTKECIMDTLGISANTWLKVKRGEAIRRSTAEYLVRRVEQMRPSSSPLASQRAEQEWQPLSAVIRAAAAHRHRRSSSET